MKKFFQKPREQFVFNQYSFVNSIKTTLACSIGLLATQLLKLQQSQWVLISIIIVMASQYRLGGAMMKGYARIMATAIGSSLAAALLFLYSLHPIWVFSLLFLTITLLIYLAGNSKDYSYAYTLGAVTMVIIVVSNAPQLRNAIDRLIEIMMGVLIAILVSRFVLPIRAGKLLFENISNTFKKLKKTYQLFIREDKTFSVHSQEKNLEEEIISNFAAQIVLLKEACAESKIIRKNRSKYTILLRLERRLLRSIYMLHNTLRVSLKSFSNIITMEEFTVLHSKILTMMEDLSIRLLDEKYKLPEYELTQTFKEIIVKLRTVFDQYSFEERNKIHAFIFCLGHVITVLNRIKTIILEIN